MVGDFVAEHSTARRQRGGGAGPRVHAYWNAGHCAAPVVPDQTILIGRATGCSLRVDDDSVSREHARLVVGPQFTIEDLGSANGTFVDGVRLAENQPHSAALDSLIEVGDALLVLRGFEEDPSQRDPDDPMQQVRRIVDRLARGTVPVTFLGDTGVGKELLAERLHERSPRANGPFVRINCAALPDSLLESELFGHERGAFTGAIQAKPGLLEAASGGSMFLDEVADLPGAMQAKLLRALECREVYRIGSLRPRSIDVRFVAATNRALEAMVDSGEFRADFFHRMCGVSVHVPPLRQRPSELAPLAREFLQQAATQLEQPLPRIHPTFERALARYDWPGNVRELKHAMECALLVCDSGILREQHLPERIRHGTDAPANDDLRTELDRVERTRIIATLEQFAGNQTRAARELGIPRRVLISRMEKHALPRPRKNVKR